MFQKIVFSLIVFFSLFACSEDETFTKADLIDDNFDSPSNYKLSATIEIFPFRSNSVRFFKRPDSKYKIESGTSDGQTIGIVFENLEIGKYSIENDNSLLLRYTSSDKSKYDSDGSSISNFVLTITEMDSTGSIVSGKFESTVYRLASGAPGKPENQRNIFSGAFKDLLLE